MPKDKKKKKVNAKPENKPKLDTHKYEVEKNKKKYLTKTRHDKIEERIDNPHTSHQNVIHNIKSFMLDKLLKYSTKKTPSKQKLRNKFEVKHKTLSNMPIFPNFPQKKEKEKKTIGNLKPHLISTPFNHLKQKSSSAEKPRIIKSFTSLEPSKVLPPKQEPIFDNFFTDTENDEFEFGFKMFPQENFDSFTKSTEETPHPHNSITLPPITSRPYKIDTTKSPQPKSSITTISTSRPTFAPMFSITPFVVSFDDQFVGGAEVRRNFKVTNPPTKRTTQKMDYEIFKEYFPEIEIKKITS